MRATPKRFLDGRLTVTWAPKRHGIWLTCDVVAPKSRVGQKVFVHLDEDACVALLLELRDHAAWERSVE